MDEGSKIKKQEGCYSKAKTFLGGHEFHYYSFPVRSMDQSIPKIHHRRKGSHVPANQALVAS